MFPTRYFPTRYFAARYWSKAAAVVLRYITTRITLALAFAKRKTETADFAPKTRKEGFF